MKNNEITGQIDPEKVTVTVPLEASTDGPENTTSIKIEEFLSKSPEERSEIYLTLSPKEKEVILNTLSSDEMIDMCVAFLPSLKGKVRAKKITISSDKYSRALMASLIVSREIRESIITHQTKSFS